MNRGIAAAGNLIVDVIKGIDTYPKRGNLVTINDVSLATGGLCPNCLIDIARMDKSVHLEAIGLVGQDNYGQLVLDTLSAEGIDTAHIGRHPTLGTSFTDVMTERTERTFFQYRGANAAFGPDAIDFDAIQADIIHFGYILLLDAMDESDPEYGTVMARTLAAAQARGFKTSIDVVSEQSDRFARLVPPSLAYTDYCIINEVEASMTADLPCRDADGKLLIGNMEPLCRAVKALGVSTWVVIHCPEGSYALDEQGQYMSLPSVDVPAEFIKGKAGAGDAFCAAVLYGAYREMTLPDTLKLASAAAVSCLSSPSASAGILPVDELMALYRQYAE